MLTDDKYFNQKQDYDNEHEVFIIAAAATLLAACTQENEVQNNPVEARITAGVSGPKTRAVDNGWNADRIGVMVVDAPAPRPWAASTRTWDTQPRVPAPTRTSPR